MNSFVFDPAGTKARGTEDVVDETRSRRDRGARRRGRRSRARVDGRRRTMIVDRSSRSDAPLGGLQGFGRDDDVARGGRRDEMDD